MRVALNARVAFKDVSGVERFARELAWAMATLGEEMQTEFIVLAPPRNTRRFRALWWDFIRSGMLARKSADVLICPSFAHPGLVFRKCIVVVHDLLFLRSRQHSRLERLYLRFSMWLAVINPHAVIVVPTAAVRNELRRSYALPEERLRVVLHGVTKFHGTWSRSASLESKEVVGIGVVRERKRWHVIASAVARLRAEGIPVSLTVFGRGRQDDYYRQLMSCEGVKVVLNASDDAIEAGLRRAAVAAFPSLEEGFGLPVLEAMAQGIPVLAADTEVFREVAGDGALFVGESIGEWASAIRCAVASPSARNALGARGALHVEQFSWRRAAESYFHIAQEIM